MKLILTKDVKKVGKKGELIDVSDGYAKNFLIPKGYAIEASNKNLNDLKLRNKKEERIKKEEYDKAKELADRLNKSKIIIQMKTGDNGKLFGSVTSKEIASAIKSQLKLNIDKKKISLEDNIKSLGSFKIDIKVHKDINANINLEVKEQ